MVSFELVETIDKEAELGVKTALLTQLPKNVKKFVFHPVIALAPTIAASLWHKLRAFGKDLREQCPQKALLRFLELFSAAPEEIGRE
jgi:hypothetical protein